MSYKIPTIVRYKGKTGHREYESGDNEDDDYHDHQITKYSVEINLTVPSLLIVIVRVMFFKF